MSQPFEANPGSLSPDMQGVIERIPAHIPEVFKSQACVAADMVTALDSGLAPNDPQTQKFLQQLDSSGWIGLVRFKAKSPYFASKSPDPKLALPGWLQNEYLERHSIKKPDKPLTYDEENQRDLAFSNWLGNKDFPFADDTHGRYYRLFSPRTNLIQDAGLKAYVEGRALVKGLVSGRLQSLIEALGTDSTGPYDMKLFEDERLVFYFVNEADTRAFEAGAIAEKIQYRGPAQDVFRLRPIAPEGWLAIETWCSNDGALNNRSDNDCTYQLKSYTPAAFLENYLNLCLNYGKNPAEPYKTSFIQIVDRHGIGLGREAELIQEAASLVSYPVAYTKHRDDIRVVQDPSIPTKPEMVLPAKKGFSLSRLISSWR